MSSSKKKAVSKSSSKRKESSAQEASESQFSVSQNQESQNQEPGEHAQAAAQTSPALVPPPARPVRMPESSAEPSENLETGSESFNSDEDYPVQQPISPPSEPLQYRAIGLIQGIYEPSEEQFNRGVLITREGLKLDAVLLGQVMSLVKKYLDLELPHLWVVYPRTRDNEPMHVQLVGVWSPKGFEENTTEENDSANQDSAVLEASLSPLSSLKPPLQDGFFSVRGQVVQQSVEDQTLFVKIQQTSRKKADTPKAFKVKLQGKIAQKPMGYFWDFEVIRDGEVLKIEKATPISFIPMKKKKGGLKRREGSSRKPIKKVEPKSQSHDNRSKSESLPGKPEETKRPLPKIIKRNDL